MKFLPTSLKIARSVFFVNSVFFFVIFSPLARAENSLTKVELENRVGAFIKTLETELGSTPGYSVAVVTKDGIQIAKGFGVLDIISGQPVDADSEFYIASATKALTGIAFASLAVMGEINLDATLDTFFGDGPAFLKDITLRELLNHTLGRESEAITWRTAFSGEQDFETLKKIFYKSSPAEAGKTFAYDNLGFNIAGLVLEEKFGKPWQKVVEEEILRPLGMTRTTAYISQMDRNNFAMPHAWYGKVHQVPFVKTDQTMHAAGGHLTTASDMARFLSALLTGEGLPEGAVEMARKPTALVDTEFYKFKRVAYGMGWYKAFYEDLEFYHHFGSFSGFRSHISYSPELGVGVAVLINELSPAGFYQPDMIAALVYDLMQGEENPEAKFQERIAQTKAKMDQMRGQDLPTQPRNAPENESRYTGQFYNVEFGTLSFFLKEGELWAKFGQLESATTYRPDGSVRVELIPYEGTLVFFEEGENGKITGLTYRKAHYQKISE